MVSEKTTGLVRTLNGCISARSAHSYKPLLNSAVTCPNQREEIAGWPDPSIQLNRAPRTGYGAKKLFLAVEYEWSGLYSPALLQGNWTMHLLFLSVHVLLSCFYMIQQDRLLSHCHHLIYHQ